jgi:hypothetical protein
MTNNFEKKRNIIFVVIKKVATIVCTLSSIRPCPAVHPYAHSNHCFCIVDCTVRKVFKYGYRDE